MKDFRHILRDINIPDVVQDKAQDAFLMIQEESRMSKKNNDNIRKGFFKSQAAAAAAVAAAILLGGGAVYAAVAHFGLLDFTQRTGYKIPEEAQQYIEKEIEPVTDVIGNDLFDCTVREALYDGEQIMLVYEVAAKESGKYLFVPTDAMPEDSMSDWSSHKDQRVQEYADAYNLKVVYIGGRITNTQELGISVQSMDFLSVSDDVMDVYVTCETEIDASSCNVVFRAIANLDLGSMDPNDKITQEINFVLENMGDATVTHYRPEEGNSVDGVSIKDIQVIRTKLGTYIDVFYDTDDMDALLDKYIKFKFRNGSEEIGYGGGSGLEFNEGGGIKERYIVNNSSLGNVLTLEAYNYIEGTNLGTVTATLK